MKIKQIFDEIANEPKTNTKMAILSKYKDNELLKRVLYLANSKRIKFYIKQIPEYTIDSNSTYTLTESVKELQKLCEREYTGSDAILFLKEILSNSTQEDAYIIERIIDKDCKIGMGTTNINKVFPNLIEKTPYQGCVPFDQKKAKALFNGGKSCLSEVKADGRYVNVIIRGGDVEMESRQGEPTILGACELVTELGTYLQDCVLNGELVMKGIPRLTANGIIASLIDYFAKFGSRSSAENNKKRLAFTKEKGMDINDALNLVELKVWDILGIDEYFEAKSTTKRVDRLNKLKTVIEDFNYVSIIEHKFVNSYEEAMQHFAEVLERGEEGTVLKSLDGGWKNGKPQYQIKLKMEMNLDLKITGFNYGNKGTKNENVISSITCESSCGKLVTRAQGLTEDMMAFVTAYQDDLLGTILEVKCSGLSSNSNGGNSVFYPAVSKFRDDKDIANSLEECIEIQNAVLGLEIKK